MCNLYDLGPSPRRVRLDWEGPLQLLLGEISYVAPGKPGLVARGTADRIEPARMRWGFHRPWSPAINNARDDKLAARTWSAAWKERRCALPALRFYEWSGAKGRKTKHAIRPADAEDAWFWIGGIWEESADPSIGLSYSMVTTPANPQMAVFHDRMPLILHPEAVEEYVLSREPPDHLVTFYPEPLCLEPPPPARSGELFDFP